MPSLPSNKRRGTHSSITDIAEPLARAVSNIDGLSLSPGIITRKRGGKLKMLRFSSKRHGFEIKAIGPQTVQTLQLFVEAKASEKLFEKLYSLLRREYDQITLRA